MCDTSEPNERFFESAEYPSTGSAIADSIYSYEGSSEEKMKLHAKDRYILEEIVLKHRSVDQPILDPKRSFNVTASDIAAICGENPYENPTGVMTKKMFKIRTPDNENTAHGRKYEPIAISMLKGKIIDGSKVKNVYYVNYLNHHKYTWLGGTLDGIVELEDGRVMVLEVKCPLKRRIISGVMPAYYMSQIQTYMFITGLNVTIFLQYRPVLGLRGKEKLDIILVKADPSYIPMRLPTLKGFRDKMVIWRYIQEERCTALSGLLKSLWKQKRHNGKMPVPDHQCDASSGSSRILLHMVNYVLVSNMCKKRQGLLEGRVADTSKTYDVCSPHTDSVFLSMWEELKACSKPLSICECMVGDIVCYVKMDKSGYRRSTRKRDRVCSLPEEDTVGDRDAPVCVVCYDQEVPNTQPNRSLPTSSSLPSHHNYGTERHDETEMIGRSPYAVGYDRHYQRGFYKAIEKRNNNHRQSSLAATRGNTVCIVKWEDTF